MSTLAIFDLDNTLLEGDSDYAWGVFIADRGLVDSQEHQAKNQYFYEQYEAGTLDIHEYHEFVFEPLKALSRAELNTLLDEFVSSVIHNMVRPKAKACVDEHRAAGHTTLIITATNSLVTSPIAPLFGVDALMATDPEYNNGALTGKIAGTPCFQTGKIDRLLAWINEKGAGDASCMDSAYFYSDSMNDEPLLSKVGNPRVVTPDERLRRHAETAGWPIMDFSLAQD
jgi:HAD superfamily hydrolase (TIGR01490 family)